MYSLKEETIKQLTPFSVVADKKKVRKIKLDGKSTQATRSGKNLFDASKISNSNIIVSDNGKTIKMPIATSGNGYSSTSSTLQELCPNLNVGDTVYLFFKKSDENYNQYIYLNGSSFLWYRNTARTITQDDLSGIVALYGNRYQDGQTEQIKIIDFIITKENNNEWEQYGASPSPEFPSEIQSVGDDVNLVDIEDGTATATKQFDITNNVELGKIYSASVFLDLINSPSGTKSRIRIDQYVNGAWIYNSSLAIISSGSSGKSIIENFTINKNATQIKLTVQNYAGGSLNCNYSNIKLQKGTVATSYSEYGKGTVTIEQRGKNKANVIGNQSITNHGITLSVDNNQIFTLSGTHDNNAARGTAFNLISKLKTANYINFTIGDKSTILKKGTYIAKIDILSENITGEKNGIVFGITTGTTTPAPATTIGILGDNNSLSNTFTLEEENSIAFVLAFMSSTIGTVINDLKFRISILEETEATDYEPYFSKDYVIPTTPLRSLPNGTKDTIEEDGIHRRVGSIVLDGSDDEGWTFYSSAKADGYVYWVKLITDCKKGLSTSICSHFKNNNYAWDVGTIGDYSDHPTLTNKYFVTDKPTVAELKAWLQQNPITVNYELSEEVVEPFTDEQLEVLESIETEKGTNIFSINGELQTTLEFQYNPELTEDIKNAFKYNVVRSYIKVLATETQEEFEINEDNYLKNVDFDDCRYVENEGIIGGVVAKETTGNFVNVDTSFDIENREFEYYLGAELDDKIHYLRLGTFIVQKPENDNVKDNTSFDALDYMVKFNIKYQDRISYPCTMLDLLLDICDQAGVVCGTKTFRNSTFIIEDNQFVGGESCRDVLKAIAQIAFSWARINEYNELVLDFNLSDEITDEIDYDEYYSLEFNEKYGPVNTIILRNSQVEGENVTIKDDNLILTPIGKNKFNSKLFEEFTAELKYIQLKLKPNTQYTMSSNIPKSGDYANLFFYPNNGETPSTTVNSVFEGHSHSITTQDDGIINIAYRDENNALTDEANNYWYQVEEGIATEYEAPIETGEIELVIADNPFAYTQAKREELIEAAKELFGFSYMPITMKTIGAAYLNCQDKIKIKNMQDGYFNTYIFDNKTSYNGTITNIIETKAMTKTETKYQYTGPISSAIKRTEIIVNKQEQTIKDIIERQDDIQKKMVEVETNIEGMNISLTTAGGNNFLYFAPEYWNLYNSTDTPRLENISSSSNEYEGLKKNTISGLGYFLKQEEVEQKITLPNGTYTLSFLYKTISTGAVNKLIVDNGIRTEYILEDVEDYTDFKIKTKITREDGTIEIEENYLTFVVNNNEVSIGFSSNSDNSIIISDLMLNLGNMKLDWTQNSNETITDTVKIGKGIEISSTADDVKFKADTDGIRILDADTDEVTSKFTRSGTETNNLIAKNSANLGGLMFKKVDNKVWITFIPYN